MSLVHPQPAAETAQACRRAVAALGWETLEAGPGAELRAEEQAGGLCCVVWPVTVEISLRPEGETATRIDLRATIAGWGPLQSRQLNDRLRSLRREIESGD